MKARVGDEVQDVFSQSQAEAQAREAEQHSPANQMKRLIRSKNPTISEEALEVACDIMLEGIETTKRLVEQGVPLDAARRAVAAALQNETVSMEMLEQHLRPQQQEQEQEHP